MMENKKMNKMQIFREILNTGYAGLSNNGGDYREVRYSLLLREKNKSLTFFTSSADFSICASCGWYSNTDCCDPPKWVVANFLPMGEEVELESLPYGIQAQILNF